MTKQHEEKKTSTLWRRKKLKGHWSENTFKINVATCWHETFERKYDIYDKDELQ